MAAQIDEDRTTRRDVIRGGGETEGDVGGVSDDGSVAAYTVETTPVGEVSLESPLERVTTYSPYYPDVCVVNGGEA